MRSGRRAARVLVVAPQPFYEDRGTPIALSRVLRALSQLSYEVDVLTFPMGRSLSMPGVRYLRVANPARVREVPIGFSLRKVWLDLFLVFAIRRQVRRQNYLCIHGVEEAAFLAVLATRGRRIPIIYDMQSSIPEQLAGHSLLGRPPLHKWVRAWERWVLRRVDRVVCSAGLARRVRALAPDVRVQEWRFPSAKADPSRGGSSRLRSELGIGPSGKIVLYAGNFEDYQGLSTIVQAVPMVLARVPEAVFVFIGANGRGGEMFRRQFDRVAPTSSYRILTRQSSDAMPDFLRLADVVVSPRSRGSNLPLKTLEYLSAGCAIVATAISAHTCVLDDNLAVLAEPTSESLGSAIADLLRDPEKLAQLRRAARSYSQDHLTWLDFVRSVGELYDRVGRNG